MSESIKAFDKAAATYEDWYRTPRGAQVFRAELLGLKKFLPSKGIGAEIGAGTGIFSESLTTSDRRIICLDSSPRMIEQSAGRKLPAILATAEHVPLREESLDFAYMVAVIEFLIDPVMALYSIREALKEDGELITLTINRESPWGAFYMKRAEGGDPIFSHARFYTFNEVSSYFGDAGYETIESSGALVAGPEDSEDELKCVSQAFGAGVDLIKARKSRVG